VAVEEAAADGCERDEQGDEKRGANEHGASVATPFGRVKASKRDVTTRSRRRWALSILGRKQPQGLSLRAASGQANELRCPAAEAHTGAMVAYVTSGRWMPPEPRLFRPQRA
jgi:hypothetical protein